MKYRHNMQEKSSCSVQHNLKKEKRRGTFGFKWLILLSVVFVFNIPCAMALASAEGIALKLYQGPNLLVFKENSAEFGDEKVLKAMVEKAKKEKKLLSFTMSVMCIGEKGADGKIKDLANLRLDTLKKYFGKFFPDVPIEGAAVTSEKPDFDVLGGMGMPSSMGNNADKVESAPPVNVFDTVMIFAVVDGVAHTPSTPEPEPIEFDEKDSWKEELLERYYEIEKRMTPSCETSLQHASHFPEPGCLHNSGELNLESSLCYFKYKKESNSYLGKDRATISASLHHDAKLLQKLLEETKELCAIAEQISKNDPKAKKFKRIINPTGPGKRPVLKRVENDPKSDTLIFDDFDLRLLIARHHKGSRYSERAAKYGEKALKFLPRVAGDQVKLAYCFSTFSYLLENDSRMSYLLLMDERGKRMQMVKELVNYVRTNLGLPPRMNVDEYPMCLANPEGLDLTSVINAQVMLEAGSWAITKECPIKEIPLNRQPVVYSRRVQKVVDEDEKKLEKSLH